MSDIVGYPPPPAASAQNTVDRLDAAAIWATLTQAQRDAIGVAGIDLVAAWKCQDDARDLSPVYDTPLLRAGERAEHDAADALILAFEAAVPDTQAETADGQPLLPASLGMVCRSCGCGENDACAGGCGWAAPHLCTACAGATP